MLTALSCRFRRKTSRPIAAWHRNPARCGASMARSSTANASPTTSSQASGHPFPKREVKGRRDGGVFLRRLQVAQRPRPHHRQSDARLTPGEDDEVDAIRRQKNVLGRFQAHRFPLSSRWIDIGGADAVSETAPLAVEVDGVAVVVVRCGAELYAVEDSCTHDGESLTGAQVEACQIICPRHGAHFCLRTGEALTPPAYEPLRTYRAREEDGRVLLERPE